MHATFDIDPTITFFGDYGSGSIFTSSEGVGLLDVTADPPRIVALARTPATFLPVQANAYDAYERHIARARDEAAYRPVAIDCAASPALSGVEVDAVFDAQLRA